MEPNGTKYLNVNPITHVLILSVPNFHTQKHVQYFLCNIFWDFKSFQAKVPLLYPVFWGCKNGNGLKKVNVTNGKIFGANMFRFIANKNDGLSNRRILAIQLAAIKLRKDIATLELFSEGVYFSVKLPIWVSNLLSSVVLPTLWVLKCNI